jgi:hypothetical protein
MNFFVSKSWLEKSGGSFDKRLKADELPISKNNGSEQADLPASSK